MMKRLNEFLQRQEGAVTADQVVLTAGVIAIALMIVQMLSDSATDWATHLGTLTTTSLAP